MTIANSLEVKEKFWSKVIFPENDQYYEECWTYTQYGINKKGEKMPFFCVCNMTYVPSRYVYSLCILDKERISDNLCVCHKCDNRLCVNPTHLFLGTHQDNVDDKIRKDRHNKGSVNGQSKLTEEKVLEIKKLLLDGKQNQKEIARLFNIDNSIIGKIKKNKIWKHVLIKE